MKTTIDFGQNGGLLFTQNILSLIQGEYSDLLDNIAAFFGDKTIVSGVTVSGGSVSNGYVVVVTNGVAELLPFVGGNNTGYVYVHSTIVNRQFNDGTQKPIVTNKQVVFTTSGTDAAFEFSLLKRLPYNSSNISAALNTVQTLIKSLINFDDAVIISGCVVSAVNTGANTLAISPGTVMFNGSPVGSQAYAGTYPAYLQPDGTFATVQPGSGDYITFDPYTSQYYVDVLKRNQHYTGEVLMSTQVADLQYFDAGTGFGKWRWLGWKISDILQSRVPLGYDRRTASGGDAAWDVLYNTPGSQAGEKSHQLTVNELPAHSHNEMVYNAVSNGGTKPVGYTNVQPGAPADSGTPTAQTGGNVAHENRQPFTVILFIEKI